MPSLRTPIGILSFPRVFSPRPRAQGGEPVFQVNLLLDKTAQSTPEFAALRRAVADQIDATFGQGKHNDREFVASLRLPFRRCAEKKFKGYDIEGGVYIAPWSKQRPGVVDAHRREITVPEDVWAGQLARATVAPFAYNNSGNRGVSFALNNLQICRTDTERLDGRIAAEDDFDEYGDDTGALVDEDAPF